MNKIFLLVISLFVFSCDDNPAGPSTCDIEIDGIWIGVTADVVFSEECDCGDGVGECDNTSNDISCMIITIEGNSTIWDSCACDGEDEDTCYEITDEGYTCEGNIVTSNCGEANCDTFIIDGNTVSSTETFDGSSEGFGEGCIISTIITLIKN